MDQLKKATKKELKRQLILDGALKAFCEKSVEASTVDDICNKVGCSHGLFYHYYKNKEELLDDLRNKWDFRYMNYISDLFNSELSPVQKLRELICYVYANLKEDEMFSYRFYFFITTSFKINELDPNDISSDIVFQDARDFRVTNQGDLQLGPAIYEIFEQGKRDGTIKTDYSSIEYIFAIVDMLVGASMSYILTPKNEKNKTILPSVDLIMSFFVRGL
jgi:AcrR family transcriptional regulator